MTSEGPFQCKPFYDLPKNSRKATTRKRTIMDVDLILGCLVLKMEMVQKKKS